MTSFDITVFSLKNYRKVVQCPRDHIVDRLYCELQVRHSRMSYMNGSRAVSTGCAKKETLRQKGRVSITARPHAVWASLLPQCLVSLVQPVEAVRDLFMYLIIGCGKRTGRLFDASERLSSNTGLTKF